MGSVTALKLIKHKRDFYLLGKLRDRFFDISVLAVKATVTLGENPDRSALLDDP